MTKSEIIHTVEALIFASGVPIKRSELYDSLPPEVTKKDINDAIKALDQTYRDPRGIVLLHIEDKVQFATNPAYGDAVAGALRPIKERELSRTLLEVLAVIAYKQPTTRGEIEEIRGGVSSDYAISTLLRFELIEDCGKKNAPGRPTLYRTTDNFLKKFGLHSIDELPDYANVMARLVESGGYNTISEGLYREVGEDGKAEYDKRTQDRLISKQLDKQMDTNELPDFLEGEKVEIIEGDDDDDFDEFPDLGDELPDGAEEVAADEAGDELPDDEDELPDGAEEVAADADEIADEDGDEFSDNED